MFFFLPMDFLFFLEDFVGQKGQILPKARPANKVIKASKNLEMVGQCVLRLFVSSGAKCMHQNFPKLSRCKGQTAAFPQSHYLEDGLPGRTDTWCHNHG